LSLLFFFLKSFEEDPSHFLFGKPEGGTYTISTAILFYSHKSESFSIPLIIIIIIIMSIIKLLFKKNVIEEVVVPSPTTTFYATAVKKFQDVVASSIVPAMTNAKLVYTELSNTLIMTTSNKVTTTVEYACDVASSIESRMQDYYYSSSSAAEVVVSLIKEQQKILLLLTIVLVALSFTILLINGIISQKKKKNESVRVVKKIHSMVTIDTTATSSSSSSISNSNSSVNESSTCTTQEEDDADADNDNEDGVCFIDDDASFTSDIVRECIGEPTMIPSLLFHDIAKSNDDNNGSSLEELKPPTSPMRKLSKKLSSNKMFKMSVKKNNLGSPLRWNSKNEI
jgi:hypothetical protein